MKISIKNFKSIDSLWDFELKPLTILSGNNSSGKSSFIQLLLILKQTLDIGSSRKQLFIQGEYYKAKSQKDLINGKDTSKDLVIELSISKSEFEKYSDLIQKSLYDSFPHYLCNLRLVFSFNTNDLQIRKFNLEYITEIKSEFVNFEIDDSGEINIDTNNISNFLTSDSIEEDGPEVTKEIRKVNYSSFFPVSYDETIRTIIGKDKKGRPMYSIRDSITRLNNNSLKSFLEAYTKELYYIGPLRIEPRDAYAGHSEKNWVGIKGEYTAQLLEVLKDKKIACKLPIFENDSISFRNRNLTLLEATNHWICVVFRFATKLVVRESGDSYSVFLANSEGIETTLKHVGFGVSQVLPIVVQGLLMEEGSTLILEQPEIHLHPKIQSYLFDFLYSLTLQGKNFIVETHSDHFITRLRRRVAEDESSSLLEQINLTFIEKNKRSLNFKKVELDEFGVYNIFPEDFIENPEKELMALLNAQMKKRKLKRK